MWNYKNSLSCLSNIKESHCITINWNIYVKKKMIESICYSFHPIASLYILQIIWAQHIYQGM
jgi:hypothetical protein